MGPNPMVTNERIWSVIFEHKGKANPWARVNTLLMGDKIDLGLGNGVGYQGGLPRER